MNRLKKALCLILIFIVTFVSCFIKPDKTSAKTLAQFRSELNAMKADYNKNHESKKMTQAEINKTKNEISAINNEIDKINEEIDELNADIKRRNEEIKKMEKEIKQIINYYQLSSSESAYLEYVFEATDFTDFIYRSAVSEQLSAYRDKTIKEYNALIEQNKKKIEEMNSKKDELDKLKSELSTKYKKLEGELTGIEIAGKSIKEEIAALENTLKLYENTYKCSENEELTKCINRYNGGSSSGYTVPSAYGFYAPINYWTYIYPFRHHDNGLDLSTPEGQSVHPIADGVVVDIWEHYNCGGNMVWIAHNVNGKKYTSAYFHLKTINVVVNQQVTHSSVIGLSGGARIWTSSNTYDTCTTGPHLHLQVATGHYDRISYWGGKFHINYSAWNSHSIDPAGIINF